jgi:nitroreductase
VAPPKFAGGTFEREAMMDIFEAVRDRRAVRDYQDRAPSRELIEQVIADAVHAPNSINRQAWSFTVVQSASQLAAISDAAKAFALASASTNAPAGLHDVLASPGFHIFYNASILIVIVATLPDAMVAQDCCLAAQTLMLSAHARGLATCWIGFAESWLNTSDGKRQLSIPEDHAVVAPIIIGYPQVIAEAARQAHTGDHLGRRGARLNVGVHPGRRSVV